MCYVSKKEWDRTNKRIKGGMRAQKMESFDDFFQMFPSVRHKELDKDGNRDVPQSH